MVTYGDASLTGLAWSEFRASIGGCDCSLWPGDGVQTVQVESFEDLNGKGHYRCGGEASRRLAVVVPITLLLILSMLSEIFGAMRPALLIFLNVPLALSGGVLIAELVTATP